MASKFVYTRRHWSPANVRKRMLESLPLKDALELCTTEAEVRELAVIRGYKPGWTWHVLQARRVAEAADDGTPPWVVE